MPEQKFTLQPSSELELFRVTSDGWLLIGTTVPPDEAAAEVHTGCGACLSVMCCWALKIAAQKGIYCKHCGNLVRHTYA